MHVYIYTKSKQKWETFYIKNPGSLQKRKTISVTSLYTKSKTLYVTQSFIKNLNLAFIYKNHDALRYVKFLYTRSQTLHKKQDNLRYVFIYKNPDTLSYAIFHWIFEIDRGGGIFICKKQCTLHHIFISKKQCTLCNVFTCKKPETLCNIYIRKKQFTLRYGLYLKFIA